MQWKVYNKHYQKQQSSLIILFDWSVDGTHHAMIFVLMDNMKIKPNKTHIC